MTANIYLLECLTNLHVGSGEVNYNIVDNEVERDVVTNYPTINSSGVKGALRAHFQEKGIDINLINQIFGKEAPGQLKFLSANLLAQAVQEINGESPFKLVRTETAARIFDEILRDFGISLTSEAEGILKQKQIKNIKEKEYLSYDLPVLARNQLNNGISANLWYEQVVPHRSLFYITVIGADEELLKGFDNVVNQQIVQFGANASIGYGLCKVTRLN